MFTSVYDSILDLGILVSSFVFAADDLNHVIIVVRTVNVDKKMRIIHLFDNDY